MGLHGHGAEGQHSDPRNLPRPCAPCLPTCFLLKTQRLRFLEQQLRATCSACGGQGSPFCCPCPEVAAQGFPEGSAICGPVLHGLPSSCLSPEVTSAVAVTSGARRSRRQPRESGNCPRRAWSGGGAGNPPQPRLALALRELWDSLCSSLGLKVLDVGAHRAEGGAWAVPRVGPDAC